MSRFTDFRIQAPVQTLPAVLPSIDWASIGAVAPAPVAVDYQGPSAPLPPADIVMFTWTDAEWSAMDHVFLHGSLQGATSSTTLTHKWLQYSKSAPSSSSLGGKLWGYYQLVDIQFPGGARRRVLLMKSDTHLAHPPWISGLENMVRAVVADARPQRIYSLGTAGGATLSQRLGDVSITNSGALKLRVSDNTPSGLSGQTFTSTYFPDLSLLPTAQKLFFPLSKMATPTGLAAVLAGAQKGTHEGAKELASFSLSDLMNDAIDPANLGSPKAVNFQGTPLLTTDFYFIESAAADFAALEMDDAVVGLPPSRPKSTSSSCATSPTPWSPPSGLR